MGAYGVKTLLTHARAFARLSTEGHQDLYKPAVQLSNSATYQLRDTSIYPRIVRNIFSLAAEFYLHRRTVHL